MSKSVQNRSQYMQQQQENQMVMKVCAGDRRRLA